eukprot:gene10036-biopygen12701
MLACENESRGAEIVFKDRGLKVSGRKEELVARVFAAAENDVKPIETAEEIEQEMQDEYMRKLVFKDYVIPDPFHLDGWLTEEEAIRLRPNILVEAAIRLGLANPACTAMPCEWLPNRATKPVPKPKITAIEDVIVSLAPKPDNNNKTEDNS